MMVSEIIETLSIGCGFSEDVERVLAYEKIYRRLNKKKKPEKPENEQAE